MAYFTYNGRRPGENRFICYYGYEALTGVPIGNVSFSVFVGANPDYANLKNPVEKKVSVFKGLANGDLLTSADELVFWTRITAVDNKL